MRGQLRFVREMGFDVTVITGPGRGLDQAGVQEGVEAIAVPMSRKVSVRQDVRSLYQLWRTLRRLRPNITNVGTPKAGLLAGMAAWVNRVPCRVYTLHGLRLETTRGLQRRLLWCCERVACACAHEVISVSESLREKAISLGIVAPEKIRVIGAGSCNGVDVGRFASSANLVSRAASLRSELGISIEAPVLGFVGRFTRDKGITELLRAFDILRERLPDLQLLLVGGFEDGDPVPDWVRRRIETDPHIRHSGFVETMKIEGYYHVMNVLALPSHREGLGNVILEAHAAGKPVVATRATGVVDAIVDGVTGILVPIGNAEALAKACRRLLEDCRLANEMGRTGRARVEELYSQEGVWAALLQEYLRLLNKKALLLPGRAKLAPSRSRRNRFREWLTLSRPTFKTLNRILV